MTTEAAERPKKKVRQQRMEGDGFPEIDADLEAAADDYAKALRAKNKAAEKLNTQKEMLIEMMTRKGVSVIRIDEGAKMLTLKHNDVLKVEKVKELVAIDE